MSENIGSEFQQSEMFRNQCFVMVIDFIISLCKVKKTGLSQKSLHLENWGRLSPFPAPLHC